MYGPSASLGVRRSHVHLVLVALVACVSLESCLAASFGRPNSAALHIPGTYCGSRLSDALRFMCNGQYNSYHKTKKTPPPPPPTPPSTPPPGSYWSSPAQVPFRDRLRAAALLESRPRVARGVFDECCSKACTLDELMSYCEVSV